MATEMMVPITSPKLLTFWRGTVLKRFPNAKLYKKRSSKKMWAIYIFSFMWIWNRKFFTNYTTVLGKCVYVNDNIIKDKRWSNLHLVLRHEFIHMLQDEKYGIWFKLSYLLPQLFAVLSLLAILAIWFGPWWLFSLCALSFLAPIPSPWRARWELEGYTQTMLVLYEITGAIGADLTGGIADKFVKSHYYFMYPFRKKIMQKINSIRAMICSGEITSEFHPYSA